MNDTALSRFWELFGQVLQLNPEAFKIINLIPGDTTVAVIIVLVAGLSQSLAQAIVLFVNRVKPLRFVLSLLIGAILFTFGYLFLVFSTWIITITPWTVTPQFSLVAKVLGFSYAPLILSLLGATPYVGVPILYLLSLWHLLAMVVGFAAVGNISVWESFSYVALGWFTLQILQQTIGQPLAKLGAWIADKTAGVTLVRTFDALDNILDGFTDITTSPVDSPQTEVSLGLVDTEHLQEEVSSPKIAQKINPSRGLNRLFKKLLSFSGLVLLTLLLIIFLSPIKEALFVLDDKSNLFTLFLNLSWIGVIAFFVGGILAPLEALGWWAGWYGDEVETVTNPGVLAEPMPLDEKVSRYVVYMDGVGQSNHEYLPEIEEFLTAMAAQLPNDIVLIKGIIPYSVLNRPLTEDRPLAFFWRLADTLRIKNPSNLIGAFVNIRNVFIVAISADQRYGPIYNRGTAQLVYNSLIHFGYKLNSGIPVTLIGYSGGGQLSVGAAPFLKTALQIPIEVISLGGVISGNVNALKVEHLYHLVGEKDFVERLGPILFSKRWAIYFLSYWNRAKRRGKISLISLGPVGHQVPGGMMDSQQYLPDGRSYLQQTLDVISDILLGNLAEEGEETFTKPSNYQLYWQSPYNRPHTYPTVQSAPSPLYQPIAPWMGRLILPKPYQRKYVKGALFQVYHTDSANQDLVGEIINLRWCDHLEVQAYLKAVTKDVHFSDDAEYSRKEGLIVPYRLNHWRLVDPLESLAGSRPQDDMVVMLPEPLYVVRNAPEKGNKRTSIYINHEPIQISGRFYALVKFVQPKDNDNPPETFKVVHFNRNSGDFDGAQEVVKLPQVIADQNEIFPSTTSSLQSSEVNAQGWYIYGNFDENNRFVVQSLAPRSLLTLQPDKIVEGFKAAKAYLRKESWAEITAKKGQISSVLLDCQGKETVQGWQEGDRGLLIHVYGGIGGNKGEPAAKSPLYFGHFAYGIARVIRDIFTGELRFDITYYQVYTHNTDGLIAGGLHWSRYMGDRQWGWLGTRPTSDIIIKLDALTGCYNINGIKASPLNLIIRQLEAMTARYRIGDGTGGTYVGAANNCAQDSNQALYISIKQIQNNLQNNQELIENWLKNSPEQAQRFNQLVKVGKALKLEMLPFGNPRPDWENNRYTLGISLEDQPIKNLITGLGSWRTMFPRLASDRIVEIFLQEPSLVWVLRTNQVGGSDPDIEPVAPTRLF